MAKAYYTCAACKQLVAVTGSNRRDADGKAEYLQKAEAVCLDCRNKAASAAGRKFAVENALPLHRGNSRGRCHGCPDSAFGRLHGCGSLL